MCVLFKRLLGLGFVRPPYRKLFSPSLITKDIGLLIRCISLFQLHRGLGDILPCDFGLRCMRNKRFKHVRKGEQEIQMSERERERERETGF